MEKEPQDKMEYINPNTKFKTEWELTPEGIISQKHFGFQDLDDSIKMMEIWESYYKKTGKKIFMILDVSGLDKSTPEANKYLNKLVLGSGSPFEKLAIVGGNFFIRTMANMYSKIAKTPMKLFKTEAEAMKWIKEGLGE